MAERSGRTHIVVFEVDQQQYGLGSLCIEKIIAIADLDCPPNTPPLLRGFLKLPGEVVPVICLRRLFRRAAAPVGLWTPVILVRHARGRIGLIADKVNCSMVVSQEVLPVPPGHVLSECIDGIIPTSEGSVLLLSPERLLLQEENRSVDQLRRLAEERLGDLEGGGA